jgi:nitrite reductase/ring-hydroxylating ferredoxin subunit
MRWIDTGVNPQDLLPNNLTPIDYENDIVAFLYSDANGLLTAYENKCSHMGDSLLAKGKRLVCPTHGWSYELNGVNENPSELGLRTLEIKINENRVFISDPRKVFKHKLNSREKPLLRVHSHACIELFWDNFTIITDPWIVGDAYYGSWKLWPPPLISVEELKADAIVITHPHPDHFHPETLKCLDKETPIYYPKFISNIIDSGLQKLGFRNIFACDFSTKIELKPKVFIEFFKPTSAWEDSIVLYSFDDFNVLNQNDAGAIFDEESLPNTIDVFACAFDQGASGYPLTWDNLSEQRKMAILKHQKEFTLKRIATLCNRYQASHFLPFAGHWRLNLKEHAEFASMIPHTNFSEIDLVLKQNTNTKLLNLYPGEFCDFMNPITQAKSQRAIVESVFIPESESPECVDLTPAEIEKLDNKFQELKSIKKSFGIESVLFKIAIDENYSFSVDLRDSESLDEIVVEVKIPKYIGKIICDQGLNWDHIAIGYWGRWSRNSTSYPSNFMRAIQTATDFLVMYPSKGTSKTTEDAILNMNVASLIEGNSDLVLRILNRHGLPCAGCFYSPAETLRKAIARHRLPIGTQAQLVRELNEYISI